MLTTRSLLTTTLAAVVLVCCHTTYVHAQATQGETVVVQEPGTIVEELADAEEFATLDAAIKAAGLIEALEDKGPFTVFAPTEEAFKKVEADTLEELMKKENREKLVALLKAHVASGEWTAAKISEVSEIPTVDGGSLTVTRRDGKIMVGTATIDHKKSIKCENGLIQCIDEVLPAK